MSLVAVRHELLVAPARAREQLREENESLLDRLTAEEANKGALERRLLAPASWRDAVSRRHALLGRLGAAAGKVTLGELGKYVALSPRRFDAVGCGTATARGSPGERLEVTFLVAAAGGDAAAWTVRVVEATVPASGVVVVSA